MPAGFLFLLRHPVGTSVAHNAKVETIFARRARAKRFTKQQISLIVGSLLGDGHLMRTTAGYCFRVHHGLAQESYVAWKYNALRDFVRTPPTKCGRGCYFRTVSHPTLCLLAERFYRANSKTVRIDILEHAFDSYAFAVWIMDDGAADGGQTRINTQCFALEEVFRLSDFVAGRFGITMTVNFDKGRPRLRVAAASMEPFRRLILPWILPQFSYKVDA